MGDFNQFDTKRLCRNSSLKQIVKKPTRRNATLDLIVTNIKCWYRDPDILPAVGQSYYVHLKNLIVPTLLRKLGLETEIHQKWRLLVVFSQV